MKVDDIRGLTHGYLAACANGVAVRAADRQPLSADVENFTLTPAKTIFVGNDGIDFTHSESFFAPASLDANGLSLLHPDGNPNLDSIRSKPSRNGIDNADRLQRPLVQEELTEERIPY